MGADPALVPVAVKVTDAPVHVGFAPVVIAILLVGVALLDTVMVTALDVAGDPVTSAKLEVMIQVTT